MSEYYYITKCLELIEAKLQWGNREAWTNSHFERLSNQINIATGISISARTLKNLFKKNPDVNYNPQLATKNALAQFINYQNWEDFSQDNKPTVLPKSEANTLTSDEVFAVPTRKKGYVAALVALVLLLMLTFLFYKDFSDQEVKWTVKDLKGYAPQTVAFNISQPNIKPNTYYIESDENTHNRYLTSDENQFMLYFSDPNYYNVRLIKKGEQVAKTGIQVMSRGWQGTITYGANHHQLKDNHELKDEAGYLHLPATLIKRFRLDSLKIDYWVDYRNIRDFPARADDCTLEMKIKNNSLEGGVSCYDSSVEIIGEQGKAMVSLVGATCQRWAYLEFGDVVQNGNFYNLLPLAQDLSKWTTVRVAIKNRRAIIFINGQQAYSVAYTKPIGNIKGIILRFKGNGSADYVRLFDAQNKLIYQDNF